MTRFRQRAVVAASAALLAVAVACSGSGSGGIEGAGGRDAGAARSDAQASPSAATTATAAAAVAVDAAPDRFAGAGEPLTTDERDVANAMLTAFPLIDPTLRTINLRELVYGAIRDEIPALTDPPLLSQDVMDRFIHPEEPVISVEVGGEARAYPVQILIFHEVVNDVIGDVPVLISYCPLCNTAIVFDRRVGGEARTFGVSGLLRQSDLVMYDHQTESLWQQITGEALVGQAVGEKLTFLPSQTVSWREFRSTFPDAMVLSINTGYVRPYGDTSYVEYDKVGTTPDFPVDGAGDDRLDDKARVLAVKIDGDAVAFPFSALAKQVVIEAEIGGQPVVAFWQPGTRSVLDLPSIAESADVGAAAAYSPIADGERLTFVERDGRIVDEQSGSTWNVLGRAIDGTLRGTALPPVIAGNHLWFAWAAFEPGTRLVTETSR